MILTSALAWIGLAVLAVINGAVREKGYGRLIDELAAHQISSLSGMILIGGYTWLWGLIRPLQSEGQALLTGVIWVGLTVAFEFCFGHLVMKKPWRKLLADYNLLAGRVWVLVLLWVLVAPLVIFKLRG
jgi:hypothetical protein